MQIHHDLKQLPEFNKAVLTTGSFDGVHMGHQKLIRQVGQYAREIGGESVIITFEPHPRQVIYPRDKGLRILTSIREKIRWIEECQVDHLVILNFTVEFSQISAQEYIEKFLVENFRPACIVMGYDHRFGLNREGDIRLLRMFQKKYGYKIIETSEKLIDDIVVSSTKIRKALVLGEIVKANRLLGHPYTICGHVIGGLRIGQTIGYPTANIQLDDDKKLLPGEGIYVVEAEIEDQVFEGLLYIGTRPTLKDQGDLTIELYILNYSGNLYGDQVCVRLLDYVRNDESFGSLEELRRRISLDEKYALGYFKHQQQNSVTQSDKVSVIILNYNGRNYLEEFGPSLKHIQKPGVRIIVADNASTDDSVSWLEKNRQDLNLILFRENHGFARGYNQAIREVKSKYIALLNSDVEMEEDWVEPLIKILDEDPEVGIVQPKVLAQKDKLRFEYAGAAGGLMDSLGYPFCRGRLFETVELDQGQYQDQVEIFWSSGAAMIIRRELFDKLGGFDPNYFAHHEEIDLCWRVKKAGYKIVCCPEVAVYHLGGGTLEYAQPRKAYLNFRNNLATLYKNERTSVLVWKLPLRLMLDIVAATRFALQFKWASSWAIFRAIGSFFRNILVFYDHRRKYRSLIQSNFQSKKSNEGPGKYKGSIVWDYFIAGKRKSSELKIKYKNYP